MTRTQRWGAGLLGLLGVQSGCTRSQTSPPLAPPPAVEDEVEAPPGPPPADAAPEPGRSPVEVARDLAQQWCREGGDLFVPPGETPPEEWIAVLESCAEIESEVDHVITKGDVTVAIISLDASYYEGRVLLLYQRAGRSHLMELHSVQDDTSGESDAVWRHRWEAIELRDVHGDPAPEWIATSITTGGDSIEAGDVCFSDDQTLEVLVICTDEPAGIRCASVPVSDYQTIEPRGEDELDDCPDPPPPDTPTVYQGYVRTATVERGVVSFAPGAKPVMDEPEEPALAGSVPIDVLLQERPFGPDP